MKPVGSDSPVNALLQGQQAADHRGVPHRFLDAATGDIMLDPVVLPGNLHMDRRTALNVLQPPALQGRVRGNQPAPLFTEAPELRAEIQHFVQEHPDLDPELSDKGRNVAAILRECGLSPQVARTLVVSSDPGLIESKEEHELVDHFLARNAQGEGAGSHARAASPEVDPPATPSRADGMMPARVPPRRR